MFKITKMDILLLQSPSDSVLTAGSISDRINILQQKTSDQSLPPSVAGTIQRNKSSLHCSGQGPFGKNISKCQLTPFKLETQLEGQLDMTNPEIVTYYLSIIDRFVIGATLLK